MVTGLPEGNSLQDALKREEEDMKAHACQVQQKDRPNYHNVV